jgi:hypothetical protein
VISVSVLRGAKPLYPIVVIASDFLKEATQGYLLYAESVKKKKKKQVGGYLCSLGDMCVSVLTQKMFWYSSDLSYK